MLHMNSTTVIYGAVIVLAYVAVHYYRKYRKWESVYNRLPGPPNVHWLFGNLAEFPGEGQVGVDYFTNLAKNYPIISRWWVGKYQCFVICHHPESVRPVLKSSAPKPMTIGTIYQHGLRWLGEGLLMSNGDKWLRNRKLLTPAFHFDILIPYASVHNKCTDTLLDKLKEVSDREDSFEAFSMIGLCSLDIICRCAFSYETRGQTEGDKDPYVKAVHRLSELWVKRSFNLFHFINFVYFNLTFDGWEFKKLCDYVHQVADEVIQQRRDNIAQNGLPKVKEGKKYLDFLDILLTATDETGKEGMSDLDIRNEVDTFMFEGHDTTTSGIVHTLLCLARDHDAQDRVKQEVEKLLQDRDSDFIGWNDLPKLEYLTMCIKEALRLYSPVHVIQRELLEDLEVKGYFVPKGTFAIVNIHSLHHNPEVWGPDIHTFRPERFSPDNIRNIDPFAFVPFAAGKRNCIGQNFAMMEMKIMIARIIHRFKLDIVPGHVYKKKMGVVMRSENGILLRPTLRRCPVK